MVPSKQPPQVQDTTSRDLQKHNLEETTDKATPMPEFILAETVQESPTTDGQDAARADDAPAQNQSNASGDLSHRPGVHALFQDPAHRSQEIPMNPLEITETAYDMQQTHTFTHDNGQSTENQSPRLKPTFVGVDIIREELDTTNGGPAAIQTSALVEKPRSRVHHAREGHESTEIPVNFEATQSAEIPSQNMTMRTDYLAAPHPTTELSTLSAGSEIPIITEIAGDGLKLGSVKLAHAPLPHGNTDPPIIPPLAQQLSLASVDDQGSQQHVPASAQVGNHIRYVSYRSHHFVACCNCIF